MGSKARHAKDILPLILKDRKEGQYYVEPFCGGCNTLDKVSNPRIGNDFHPHLITMWKYVERGWLPPEFVSEDEYNKLNKERIVSPLTGYVGFSLSFGGKFFGGYRRDVQGTKGCVENMKTQSRRSYQSMVKQSELLKGVDFRCGSYLDLYIPPNSIIYCDPPYANTTKYSTDKFDHDEFWKWCEQKVEEGHQVFVSEYNAPSNWTCIWSKEVNNTLVKDTGSKKGVEKLFTLEVNN